MGTNLEKTKLLFSHWNIPIETEDDGKTIVIDNLLRIDPSMQAAVSIRATVQVPGFVLRLDTGEDVQELASGVYFDRILVEAVKWYSGWKAGRLLEAIGDGEYAAQCAYENTPEFKAKVKAK